MFPGHTLRPLPSSCLYSNPPPPSSTFNLSSSPISFFPPPSTFFSLLLAHFALKLSSPLLLFPTLTSRYHDHFSLSSLHSPLIFPVYSRFLSVFHLCWLISTHLSPLSTPVLPKHCSHISPIHSDALFLSLIKLSSFSSSAVSFPFCLCLPTLPPPTPFFLLQSFFSFLLTVSRAWVLSNLSKPLTTGSIVSPLIITYHPPSALSCPNAVCHWAPLFSQSPCGWLIVQKCILFPW